MRFLRCFIFVYTLAQVSLKCFAEPGPLGYLGHPGHPGLHVHHGHHGVYGPSLDYETAQHPHDIRIDHYYYDHVPEPSHYYPRRRAYHYYRKKNRILPYFLVGLAAGGAATYAGLLAAGK